MTNPSRVHADATAGALVIENLVVDDPRVLGECRHWSNGQRGEPVDLAALAAADLTSFAVQAMTIGSCAMGAAAGVQERYGIEALVAEVEQRSTQAAAEAAERTKAAVDQASSALEKTSTQVKEAVVEAGTTARATFTESVEAARKDLRAQISALFGGEEPQLMLRLQPLLDGFSRSLEARTAGQTSALIEKVTKQFDPADPASPMAQQMRALGETQAQHARAAAEQQRLLTEKVEALTAGLATARATDALAARTPLKGATYEDQVHALMAEIAAGLGDEYVQTGNVVGLRTRNKKGDGVLTAAGSDSRVVVEMTDSPRGSWSAYLQEAEANRGAQASLGLVRHDHQLPGGPILTFGPRRIVMVFDPETDSVHLLRCVVQVLRLAAVSAAVRVESGEVATAAERLAEALTSLERIAKIRKSAGQVQRTAVSIDTEAEALESTLTRLLTQIRTALASVLRDPQDDVA